MLGLNAKDTITGLAGVITAKAEYLYGTSRYELSPTKLNEGKPVEGVWLDSPRLKLGSVHTKVKEVTPTIKLGENAKDKLTGFKGVCTAHYTFLNGCLRVEITPHGLSSDGKTKEVLVVDEQRVTGESKAETGGPRTGPPTIRLPRS